MKIGIIGTGAYGMALASVLENNNNEIIMWTKFEESKVSLEQTNKLPTVFGNYTFSKNIKYTTNIEDAILEKDIILWVIPAKFLKETLASCKNIITSNQIFLLASKGIDSETGEFLHKYILDNINTDQFAIISGPSFAIDIIDKTPIGLTVASLDTNTIKITKKIFENDYFKLRETNDLIGTAICGSIKNVIAIASGMLNGLNVNESTKALFLNETIHDIKNFIKDAGGDQKTILSLAGFGDLLLTATSSKSRNYSFGEVLCSNDKDKIDNFIKNNTIEGLNTLQATIAKMNKDNIDMPIIRLIYDIIYNNVDPKELYKFLIEKEY